MTSLQRTQGRTDYVELAEKARKDHTAGRELYEEARAVLAVWEAADPVREAEKITAEAAGEAEETARASFKNFANGGPPDPGLDALLGAGRTDGRKQATPRSELIAAIRRALMDESQDTWDVEGPAREDVPGAAGLLHRGVPVTFFGPRGEGKSTVGLTLGLGAAAAGERVLYLDRENGAFLTRSRVESALSARPEWTNSGARERFAGRHYPRLDGTWTPEAFGDAIEAEGFTVVIFDSVREMLRQLGLGEDATDDYSRLHALLGTSLAERGITPVFLDNVGHKDKHRPRGSSSKLDATPQGFEVVTTARFAPDTTGLVKIVCQRSRYGDEGRVWKMSVGGGTWSQPQPDWAIERLLAQLPGDEWRSRNAVAEGLKVSRQAADKTYIRPAQEAGAVETKHEGGRNELMVRRRPSYTDGDPLQVG